MAATLSQTLAAGASSTSVPTVPNEVFSVQTSGKVRVQSKNTQAGADEWHQLGRVYGGTSASFIATGETIRVVAIEAADIEVFT